MRNSDDSFDRAPTVTLPAVFVAKAFDELLYFAHAPTYCASTYSKLFCNLFLGLPLENAVEDWPIVLWMLPSLLIFGIEFIPDQLNVCLASFFQFPTKNEVVGIVVFPQIRIAFQAIVFAICARTFFKLFSYTEFIPQDTEGCTLGNGVRKPLGNLRFLDTLWLE